MNHLIGATLLASLVILLLGYFLGCLNGSVMVSHFIIKDDVRQHGSGNAGLTNFYRTYGAKYALGVILFDMGKTVIACLIGGAAFDYLAGDWMLGVLLGGLGCELGHMFPVFFGFKGGKGILSGGTLVWLLDWRVGLIAWGLFAALWLLTKYVSLGSVCAAASMPVTTFFLLRPQPPLHGAGRADRRAGDLVPPGEYHAPAASSGAQIPMAHRHTERERVNRERTSLT